jgi:hypothetical protein
MKRKLTVIGFCFVALVLALSGVGMMAQTITGSVRGAVTDPSGAVVAGANITATNVDTGVALHTTSNKSGAYNFQFLVIGKYTVTASAPGFATQVLGPFDLRIDQIAAVNPKLTVGRASTEVSVEAESTLLNTENSTISTSISSQTLENMPLNGLNIQIATLFVPGAINPNATAMSGTQGTGRDAVTTHTAEAADAIPSFNGNRQQANSYILDGIDINETLANAVGYNPSPFSIQEVHVITGNADAEFGNVNGGEIVMVTKGGTNKFHGSVFEFHEASGLTANTWANKNNVTPARRALYTQNQFGAAVGGPILKDKLFFFANYIGMRHTNPPSDTFQSVPTLAQRGQGPGATPGVADFSDLLATENHPIYDRSGGYNGQVQTTQIPILNPVAQYLFNATLTHPNLWPAPNHTPNSGFLTANNFLGKSASIANNDQGDLRVDYTPNNDNTFMAKFSHGEAYDVQTQVAMQALFPANNDYPFTNLSLGYTHVFSPRIVNNLRAGYTRITLNQNIVSDPSGLFGINGDAVVGIPLPNQAIAGFSYMDFGQYSGGELSNVGTFYGPLGFSQDNTFDYNDTLTWQHGNHVTKFGADFVRYQQAFFEPSNLYGQLGSFLYVGDYTNWGYADFLQNQSEFAQVAEATGPFGQRQWRSAVYVQDDWKALPNLTLNLGMRYSYEQPIYEVNNKMVNVNISRAMFAPAGTSTDSMLDYAGAFNSATGKTNSRALYNPYYFNFMPRFGFALSVTPRLVLRGGYGMTDELESTGTGRRLTQNPQFQPSHLSTATGPDDTSFGSPTVQVQNGFGSSANTGSYNAWDPNLRPAVIQQFNLTTQYLLNKNTSLQIGYIGQIGKHLAVPIALNQYTQDAPSNCDDACFQAIVPFNALAGSTGSVVETASRAISNYNALQATLQRQQSSGLTFMLNYTLSKSMTNNIGYFGVDGAGYGDNYWQDINNPMGDYGPSVFDARHNVSGIVVYELPFGHQKQFGGNWNRLTDGVLGGWQLSANIQINSGYPIAIVGSPHCKNNCPAIQTGDYVAHANQYRPMKIVHRGRTSSGQFSWFGTDPSVVPCKGHGIDNGTCAYGQIADFGNAHPGTERGPGFQNYDLSVVKSFRVIADQSLKARVDAFNAFNISSYALPGNNVQSPTAFGVISGTRSGPRTIQLSVIYQF